MVAMKAKKESFFRYLQVTYIGSLAVKLNSLSKRKRRAKGFNKYEYSHLQKN